MIESTYNPSFLRPLFKLVSPLGILFHYIIKVMDPLHNMPKAIIIQFAIYYQHYKNKFVSNSIWKFGFNTNYLYFLCGWNNLLAVFFFAYDSGICVIKLGIIIKKGKLLRISLHYFELFSLTFLLLLSLIFSKMSPVMFKYALMSKWKLENLLKASSNPFLVAQTAAKMVEFLPDNIALLNKRLL